MKNKFLVFVFILFSILAVKSFAGPPVEASSLSTTNSKKGELYVSVYFSKSFPADGMLTVDSRQIPEASFGSALGGGLKAGWYPAITRRFVGLEIEFSGHTVKITAPGTFSEVDSEIQLAKSKLEDFPYMGINLLLQYPGQLFQPYIGIGVGMSVIRIDDINVLTREDIGETNTESIDSSRDQFMGGLRINMTKCIFWFGEYRFFRAAYKSEWYQIPCSQPAPYQSCYFGGPELSLDLRNHLAIMGIGIRR